MGRAVEVSPFEQQGARGSDAATTMRKSEIAARATALQTVKTFSGTYTFKRPWSFAEKTGYRTSGKGRETQEAAFTLEQTSSNTWEGTASGEWQDVGTNWIRIPRKTVSAEWKRSGRGTAKRLFWSSSGKARARLGFDDTTGELKLEIGAIRGRNWHRWMAGTDGVTHSYETEKGPIEWSVDQVLENAKVASGGSVTAAWGDAESGRTRCTLSVAARQPRLQITDLDLRELPAGGTPGSKLRFLSARLSAQGGVLPIAGRVRVVGPRSAMITNIHCEVLVGTKVLAYGTLVADQAARLTEIGEHGYSTGTGRSVAPLFELDLAQLGGIARVKDPNYRVSVRVRVDASNGESTTAMWSEPVTVLLPVEHALHALEQAGIEVGKTLRKAAEVRGVYQARIRKMSDDILHDIRAGKATPADGMRHAVGLRNEVMAWARKTSGTVATSWAKELKDRGKTIRQLVDEKAGKLWLGRPFSDLNASERRAVFVEIVRSSGRSRSEVSKLVPLWKASGMALLGFTAGVCVLEVLAAENHKRAAFDQVLIFGTASAGASVLPAAAALLPTPPGAIVTTMLWLVGAVAGAWLGSMSAEDARTKKELREWLGD